LFGQIIENSHLLGHQMRPAILGHIASRAGDANLSTEVCLKNDASRRRHKREHRTLLIDQRKAGRTAATRNDRPQNAFAVVCGRLGQRRRKPRWRRLLRFKASRSTER